MRFLFIVLFLFTTVFIATAEENNLKSHTKKFYFKGGYSLISKNYFGINDSKDPNFYSQIWENTSSNGANFELGSLFQIQQLGFGNHFAIGIDVNYLTSDYVSLSASNGGATIMNVYSIGSAIGPVFTYNLKGKIAFDLYFKVNPLWFSMIDVKSDKEGYFGFNSIKYKIGFNARLDFLVLSAEFNPGGSVLRNYDYTYESFDNLGQLNDYYDKKISYKEVSRETPLPVFNFNIGFCF